VQRQRETRNGSLASFKDSNEVYAITNFKPIGAGVDWRSMVQRQLDERSFRMEPLDGVSSFREDGARQTTVVDKTARINCLIHQLD
jgi:hypothetical protein